MKINVVVQNWKVKGVPLACRETVPGLTKLDNNETVVKKEIETANDPKGSIAQSENSAIKVEKVSKDNLNQSQAGQQSLQNSQIYVSCKASRSLDIVDEEDQPRTAEVLNTNKSTLDQSSSILSSNELTAAEITPESDTQTLAILLESTEKEVFGF